MVETGSKFRLLIIECGINVNGIPPRIQFNGCLTAREKTQSSSKCHDSAGLERDSQTVNINRRWRATVLFISTRANVNLDTVGSHHHHHHHPVGDGRHYQQKNKLAICTVEPIIW